MEPVDSYRRIDAEGSRTVDRARLRIVQTPQAFNAGVLRNAYENPFDEEFTDDASVVERWGHAVFLCEGERTNLKITTPEDLVVAEALLEAERTDDKQKTANDDFAAAADRASGEGKE